jgi:hypothetical protein
MSKAFWFQTAVIRIALIALAIQGVSPDADGLTSFSLARILLTIVADSITSVDDSTPLEGERPDEVCVPTSAGMDLLLRRRIDFPRNWGLKTALVGARRFRPNALHRPPPAGGYVQHGEIILSLCRLSC